VPGIETPVVQPVVNYFPAYLWTLINYADYSRLSTTYEQNM